MLQGWSLLIYFYIDLCDNNDLMFIAGLRPVTPVVFVQHGFHWTVTLPNLVLVN